MPAMLQSMSAVCVRADNPSPMTLEGTNTWVVGEGPCWVVDPGPALDAHVAAVRAEAERRGGAAGILLTHGHADHAEGVPALAQALGCGLVAPQDGPFEVLPTPGHSPDHVAYDVGGGAVCTCDAVLGRGSVFVAAAPGALAGYLDALRALRARPGLTALLPGHGPVVEDPYAKLDEYLAHRLEREARLVAALDDGVRDPEGLLDAAWADVPAHLRPVAGITLRAHLHKLEEEARLPDGVVWPELPAWASQVH
jgi:glyoxylase-like metal-dependent hydrolase (beta-lactamase superfamily II)